MPRSMRDHMGIAPVPPSMLRDRGPIEPAPDPATLQERRERERERAQTLQEGRAFPAPGDEDQETRI